MRTVLDTNVWVSAVLAPEGPPGRIHAAWLESRFQVLTSLELMSELAEVFGRPRIARRVPAHLSLTELLDRIQREAQFFDESEHLDVVGDDADNRVLEVALAGAADYVVTGDHELLRLREFRGSVIVTPALFAALLDGAGTT